MSYALQMLENFNLSSESIWSCSLKAFLCAFQKPNLEFASKLWPNRGNDKIVILFRRIIKKAVGNYSLHLKIISNFKIIILLFRKNTDKIINLPPSAREKDQQIRNRLGYHILIFSILESSTDAAKRKRLMLFLHSVLNYMN